MSKSALEANILHPAFSAHVLKISISRWAVSSLYSPNVFLFAALLPLEASLAISSPLPSPGMLHAELAAHLQRRQIRFRP